MLTLCPRPGHCAHTVSFTSPNVLKFRPYAHCWFSSLAHTSKMNGLRPDHTLSWCGNDIHSQVYHQYPHCQHYVRLPATPQTACRQMPLSNSMPSQGEGGSRDWCWTLFTVSDKSGTRLTAEAAQRQQPCSCTMKRKSSATPMWGAIEATRQGRQLCLDAF